MKKSIFIIAAAALVVSCANNDVKNDIVKEDIPIGFSNVYVGKQTKANAGEMTGTWVTGNTMKVWGWKTYNETPSKVFNGVTVTYNEDLTGGTTKWEYSPLKYWDFAASYAFYAVAPATNKFSINETTKIISATNVEPVQVLADNNGASKVTSETTTAIDYLVATYVPRDAPKGNASDGDVEFTFNHILSKLAVSVLTTDAFNKSGNNYPQIKLTNLSIKLQGMCPSYTQKTAGSVTDSQTAGDTWSGTAMAETSFTCFDSKPVADDPEANTVEDLLLTNTAQEVASYLVAPTKTGATPATYQYIEDTQDNAYKVSVEYDIYYSATEGDSEHFVVEDKNITGLTSFAQDTKNTLTITISPQAIFFDVQTVVGWTNGANGTVTIQ